MSLNDKSSESENIVPSLDENEEILVAQVTLCPACGGVGDVCCDGYGYVPKDAPFKFVSLVNRTAALLPPANHELLWAQYPTRDAHQAPSKKIAYCRCGWVPNDPSDVLEEFIAHMSD